MKLPWKNDELKERIDELEQKIEELKEEKQSWKDRYEAEENRRKKLSREKQEAQEKLNRLEDRKQTEQKEPEDDIETEENSFENLSFNSAKRLLDKLDMIESAQNDMVTVYSPGKLEDFSDLKALKNSVKKKEYEEISDRKDFVAFFDEQVGNFVLKMSPFYSERIRVSDSFDVGKLQDFIEKEKYFVTVSSGNTKVFREQAGDFEEVEAVKSRVDAEHKKGGFSQARFERKRKEQIETHKDMVADALEGFDADKLYLLGDRKLCQDLKGTYLGGFDPNRSELERFYGFRLLRF